MFGATSVERPILLGRVGGRPCEGRKHRGWLAWALAARTQTHLLSGETCGPPFTKAARESEVGGGVVEQHHRQRSVDPVAGTSAVDGLEGSTGALVEETLGLEALVLVVTVGGHAGAELAEVVGAELLEDILAGGALILTGEAAHAVSLRGPLTR